MAQAGKRLAAQDWAAAALDAVGEQGLAAVAVEPLAARLGTTKGSFYWHYANRAALVEAALALWEQRHTDQIIAAMDAESDPAQRLRRLFATITAGHGDRIEVNLLTAADHPAVAPVMHRVVDRRIDYVAAMFRQLGCTDADAHRRALLAYSAYLGGIQLAARMPGLMPQTPSARQSYVDTALAALLP